MKVRTYHDGDDVWRAIDTMQNYSLPKEDQAKFHHYVYDGLVQSILKSGDGKSPASAYVVISTDEEYAVLRALGIRSTQQALMGEKGEKIDRISGVNEKSNETVTLYFNVTRPFKWLEDQFKKNR